MAEARTNWSSDERRQIELALEGILDSGVFSSAERQRRLLKFLIQSTLDGQDKRLNQYTIGIDVFDRDETFDPAIDSIVRVEVARLRSKLRDYYDEHGATDFVRFDLPKGIYKVRIHFAEAKHTGSAGVERQGDGTDTGVVVGNVADRGLSSIAVLPFDNISGDPEQEYFVDGITDDLILALSRLKNLDVTARHSSFRYKGVAGDLAEIANDLNVRYLIEGSVRRSGDRVRVNAELVDATKGTGLWGERYDREIVDIFDMQDDITRSVATALELRFLDAHNFEQSRIGTYNVRAYEALLQGRHLLYHWTHVGVTKAIRAFDEAATIDPDYVYAYIWRARAKAFIGINRWVPDFEAFFRSALADARKAVSLREDMAFAHTMVAWSHVWLKDFDAAKQAADTAFQLELDEADALHMTGMVYAALGDHERPLSLCQKAFRLNPIPPASYHFAMATGHFVRSEWELVVDWCDRGITENPDFYPNYWILLATLGLTDQSSRAAEVLQSYQQAAPQVVEHADQLFFIHPECRDKLVSGLSKVGLLND